MIDHDHAVTPIEAGTSSQNDLERGIRESFEDLLSERVQI